MSLDPPSPRRSSSLPNKDSGTPNTASKPLPASQPFLMLLSEVDIRRPGLESSEVASTLSATKSRRKFLTSESPSPPRKGRDLDKNIDSETRSIPDIIFKGMFQDGTGPSKGHDAADSEQSVSESPRVSPTPSLPDVHELLASTQGGRKPKARPSYESSQSVVTHSIKAKEEEEEEIMEIDADDVKPLGASRRVRDGVLGAAKKRVRSPARGNEASTSPAKRQRGTRRRHSDFWALDGSVVLQFEDIMFRLHRSDLVRRSKYFANLLDARDGEAHDTVDGCPLYHVPGKAKDFERLWHAVEDAISFVHTPPPFPVFASILRASTDLDFPSFRTWALKTFEEMWSLRLDSLTADRQRHATESIVLARSCDVPNVLRHAFYELSRHPSFGLADENADSLSVDLEDEEDDPSGLDTIATEEAQLSYDDITRLIQLRTRLQTEWVFVVHMPPSSCGKNGCQSSSTWFRNIFSKGSIFEEGLMFDPLGGLEQLAQMKLRGEEDKDGWRRGMCAGCEAKAKNGWEKRRTKIWEHNLDLWLGLQY